MRSSINVRANLDQSIGDLKQLIVRVFTSINLLSQSAHLSTSPAAISGTRCILEKYGGDTTYLGDDTKLLRTEGVFKGNKVLLNCI